MGVLYVAEGNTERIYHLKKINFPSTLKKIEGDAFDASGIESVSLKHVEKVRKGAFSGSELRHVTIRSTQIKKWGKEVFGKARKDLVIRVPKSKKKEYTKALRKGGLPNYVKIVGM